MPTLVETVGASDANSYVSVSEATAYFDEVVGASTAWAAADADDTARALIQATRRLDQEEWKGSPVRPLTGRSSSVTTQALKWPRHGVKAPDGWYYAQDQIPAEVKRATMKLALLILAGDFETDDTGLEGFKSLAVDVIRMEPRHAQKAGVLPGDVRREIRHLLEGLGSINFRIQRG